MALFQIPSLQNKINASLKRKGSKLKIKENIAATKTSC